MSKVGKSRIDSTQTSVARKDLGWLISNPTLMLKTPSPTVLTEAKPANQSPFTSLLMPI